jgi:hypothetical protein
VTVATEEAARPFPCTTSCLGRLDGVAAGAGEHEVFLRLGVGPTTLLRCAVGRDTPAGLASPGMALWALVKSVPSTAGRNATPGRPAAPGTGGAPGAVPAEADA